MTDQDQTEWIGSEPMQWADESYRITISPDVEYCVLEQGECRYEPGNPTWDDGEAEKRVVVDDAYLDRHLPTVRDRLKRAGVRLGHMLNKTLGQ